MKRKLGYELVQAYRSGVFGRKLTIFSLAVAVVLLASFLFVPIVALLIWLIAASITLLRHPDTAAPAH